MAIGCEVTYIKPATESGIMIEEVRRVVSSAVSTELEGRIELAVAIAAKILAHIKLKSMLWERNVGNKLGEAFLSYVIVYPLEDSTVDKDM